MVRRPGTCTREGVETHTEDIVGEGVLVARKGVGDRSRCRFQCGCWRSWSAAMRTLASSVCPHPATISSTPEARVPPPSGIAAGIARLAILAIAAPLAFLLVSCSDVGQPRRIPEDACQDPNGSAGPWNGHQAAFTFSSDDNSSANLDWVKVFQRRGVRFTIFTVPRWLDRPGKLTGADLRDLHARGFEVGGHSMTHQRLTQVDDQRLTFELQACRDTLTRIVMAGDYTCRSYAYPYHDHDARVMEATARFYSAARDGGLSSAPGPGFSRGIAGWDSVSLFEVPLPVTIGSLVNKNQFTAEETQTTIQNMLPGWTEHHRWVNVYAHVLSDCDTTHMGYILDAVLQDGRVWVAPFGEVAAYYQRCRCK